MEESLVDMEFIYRIAIFIYIMRVAEGRVGVGHARSLAYLLAEPVSYTHLLRKRLAVISKYQVVGEVCIHRAAVTCPFAGRNPEW